MVVFTHDKAVVHAVLAVHTDHLALGVDASRVGKRGLRNLKNRIGSFLVQLPTELLAGRIDQTSNDVTARIDGGGESMD